ncbi:MAG: hypothetical protein KME30_29295 [Iphinoe sp. HA4291-MV1]|jgi:hypothetical protein|nr:hypothetical protein [Iphinoe sp. HA4291-MV1]
MVAKKHRHHAGKNERLVGLREKNIPTYIKFLTVIKKALKVLLWGLLFLVSYIAEMFSL